MDASELMSEIDKLGVLELEQSLKQLQGRVAVTRKLLALAKARHRKCKRTVPTNGEIAGAAK